MIPGQMLVAPGQIELNAGRATRRMTVANTGDRPIQVGSHFHFHETNPALRFDRDAARGFRLNIAAGTAVRFEPGQEREVELVALAGDRVVVGFNARVMGSLDSARMPAAKKATAEKATAEKATAEKATAEKATAKQTAAKKTAAKKTAATRQAAKSPSTISKAASKRGARK